MVRAAGLLGSGQEALTLQEFLAAHAEVGPPGRPRRPAPLACGPGSSGRAGGPGEARSGEPGRACRAGAAAQHKCLVLIPPPFALHRVQTGRPARSGPGRRGRGCRPRRALGQPQPRAGRAPVRFRRAARRDLPRAFRRRGHGDQALHRRRRRRRARARRRRRRAAAGAAPELRPRRGVWRHRLRAAAAAHLPRGRVGAEHGGCGRQGRLLAHGGRSAAGGGVPAGAPRAAPLAAVRRGRGWGPLATASTAGLDLGRSRICT